jgi:hypothetical protein
MEILEEKNFEYIKDMLRNDKKLAILGIKTNSIEQYRRIVVSTDKWKAIVVETFRITKNGKVYLKRTKESEIIISGKFLYTKHNGGIKIISPFNYAYLSNKLITKENIFEFYGVDFLLPYSQYLRGLSVSYIRKNKITNIKQLLKLKYPNISYPLLKKIMGVGNSVTLSGINEKLKLIKTPQNVIVNKFEDVKKYLLGGDYMFDDLFNMAKQLDKKVDITWSTNRIKLEHDTILKELKIIKKNFVVDEQIKVNKRFHNLLPESYELISSTMRLYEEGEMVNHCVYTSGYYMQNIINGRIAIYSRIVDNKRYTLELTYVSHMNQYKVNQFRGYSNAKIPDCLDTEINSLIAEINKNISVVENISDINELETVSLADL